jgi:hypothetical protein
VVDIGTYPCYNGSVRQIIVLAILSPFSSAAEHVLFGDIAMPERPIRKAVTMRIRMVVSTFAMVSFEQLTMGSRFF